jgi:DNA-binding NarL/FixJ family response regulator
VTDAPRVLVADDHPPTRAGVREVLEANGFTVCAECATAEQAVAAAVRERPAVCLLDIRMPGSGIAAAAAISAALPECAIVMLTVSRDDADLFDALRAGGAGGQLEARPRVVLAGDAPLPANLVARLIEEFRARENRKRVLLANEPGVELRRREWEVLELLREGLTTGEIARRLFIAEVTVRSHVSAILKALRVPDRAAAVKLLDDR